MQSHIGHLVFYIDPQNAPFYKDLLAFMGWKIWYDEPGMLGMGEEGGGSLWFSPPLKAHENDYDGRGLNHLGIGVGSLADVDAAVGFLRERGIPALFETPRHRPEFSASPDKTYYQVMFETPDRILIEVVYTGPKDE